MDLSSFSNSFDMNSQEPLLGIVVKLDFITERALVRVMIEQDNCDMPYDEYQENDINHLFIPFDSPEAAENEFEMGSIIKILEYEGPRILTSLDEAMRFTTENPAEITRFSVVPQDNKYFWYPKGANESLHIRSTDNLLAVTEVKYDYLKVVGSVFGSTESIVCFPRMANRYQWKDLPMHSFIFGDLIRLPEHYRLELKNDIPELIFDHRDRRSWIRRREKKKSLTVPRLPLCIGIRQLTDIQIETIRKQARNKDNISYDKAVQFVLDPLLVCSDLEDFVAKNSAKQYTSQVTGLIFDFQNRLIYVPITQDIKRCLTNRSRDTWLLGADLVLETLSFGGNNVQVVLERNDSMIRGLKHLRLSVSAGYERVLDIMHKEEAKKDWSKARFTLGPKHAVHKNINTFTIRFHFEKFYEDSDRFKAFIGKSAAPDLEQIYEEFFARDGVDESQQRAKDIALYMPGFTCVSAPPGSGKTSLISGIVSGGESERFAVCATTNHSVTNTIETGGLFSCIRQFSPSAEAALDKNAPILKISLRRMIQDQELIQSFMWDKGFANAIYKREKAKREMLKQTNTVEEQLDATAQYQYADAEVGGNFVRCYAPTVFAATASILSGVAHKDISHLIIDEASQMSQVDALFLYCKLPHLKYITLIGDTKQLGPFTDINRGTLAFEIMRKSELRRQLDLRSSAKAELDFLYRSHPHIVDLLLKPIYGTQLISATPAHERNLAVEKGLPRALDGSPVLFVQIDGEEQNGRNEQEAEVVLKFLDELMLKGVNSGDISILCHLKAQKDSLCQALLKKEKGSIGRLDLKFNINTIDGYQGREAKVVLVLYTKTCPSDDPNLIRETYTFVSNAKREAVALSRAQHAIYLFGNWRQMYKLPFWRKLWNGISNSGAIVDENWQTIYKDRNAAARQSHGRRR